MKPISTDLAIRLRKRGITLSATAHYEDFRVATIAAAQDLVLRKYVELEKRMLELDEQLLQLASLSKATPEPANSDFQEACRQVKVGQTWNTRGAGKLHLYIQNVYCEYVNGEIVPKILYSCLRSNGTIVYDTLDIATLLKTADPLDLAE